MRKTVLLITFLTLVLSSCTSYQSVTIDNIENVKFRSLEDNVVKLDIYAKINNPNKKDIHISDININVRSDNTDLGKIQKIDKIVLAKNTSDVYRFQIESEIDDLIGGAMKIIKLSKSKNIELHFEGYIIARAGVYRKKIEIDQTERLR